MSRIHASNAIIATPKIFAISNFFTLIGLLSLLTSCVPTNPVEFRSVRNIVVDMGTDGEPVVTGQAVFFNPNKLRMKLKEVKLQVFVDGKQAALVDQMPNLEILPLSEFTVAVEARLSLKELGLMDAVLGFFGGKKYQLQYQGYVRVRVHGVTVKVPVDFHDEFKLKR